MPFHLRVGFYCKTCTHPELCCMGHLGSFLAILFPLVDHRPADSTADKEMICSTNQRSWCGCTALDRVHIHTWSISKGTCFRWDFHSTIRGLAINNLTCTSLPSSEVLTERISPRVRLFLLRWKYSVLGANFACRYSYLWRNLKTCSSFNSAFI